MSYADTVFINVCRDILDNGISDAGCQVRPHWEDGAPAYTVKKFGVVNRYDLQKEFPIMTLRRTYWKSALDELLWIYPERRNTPGFSHGDIRRKWLVFRNKSCKRFLFLYIISAGYD